MNLTQKHFQLIARILLYALNSKEVVAYDRGNEIQAVDYTELVDKFANELAQTNPKFKRELFYKACGITVEVTK